MNKVAALFLVFVFALPTLAAEKRTFKKTGRNTARVLIETEERDTTQAAQYADAKENDQFIRELLKDPSSKLALLKKHIELDNCQQNSTSPDGWIPGCGAVELTNYVRTSFGRGGWMEGGSSYTFFVGFRFEGSGHFFDATHMVVIGEHVQAQVDQNMNYKGTVVKDLNLSSIVSLPIK